MYKRQSYSNSIEFRCDSSLQINEKQIIKNMKDMKYIKCRWLLAMIMSWSLFSCTNLDEEDVYKRQFLNFSIAKAKSSSATRNRYSCSIGSLSSVMEA